VAEQWWHGQLVDRFVGSHPGFERLGIGASHERAVWFMRGKYWVIVDTVTSIDASEAAAHFHWPLGSKIEAKGQRTATVQIPSVAGGWPLFFCAAGDIAPILWGDDWVSPAYGCRVRAPTARLVSQGRGTRQLISVLCPAPSAGVVACRELAPERGRTVIIDRPDGYDQLLLAADGQFSMPGLTLRGEGALLCRDANGMLQAVALFGAEALLEIDGTVFTAQGAAEAVLRDGSWEITGNGSARARP
jgi:hypothetical protein